jgi:hypothetical protein
VDSILLRASLKSSEKRKNMENMENMEKKWN